MEYGAPVPIRTRDDGTLQAGPDFSFRSTEYTYVEADWREVPSDTRDQLRAFRLWLQKRLDVHFQITYHREERDEENAVLALLQDTVRRLDDPHSRPKTHRHSVPWAGQVETKFPMFVRLNVEAPAESMLLTLAHEARHVWQLHNWETFLPKSVVEHRNVDAARDLMEGDAMSYAKKALAEWKAARR